MDDNLEVNSWIGVVISIIGNVLISVALNVQKLAHNKIQKEYTAIALDGNDSADDQSGQVFFPDDGYPTPRNSEDSLSEDGFQDPTQAIEAAIKASSANRNQSNNYLHNPLWWLGIILMIFGELGNFIAYGFAPASTIAPLGTTTLISNVVMAPLILREKFRLQGLVGVLFAVFGASIVVFSSKSEEVALSPELIVEALTQVRSIVYFAITGAAIIALTVLSPRYGAKSIIIDLGLVAIYGGYTVLATKSISSLLSMSFTKMFAFSVSYLLVFVLVFTAIIQIKYLNRALQRFDSTEVIPTQFVLFTISAIIGSAVLYHDFDNLKPHQMLSFVIGCTIEFFGVLLITSSRQNRPASLSIQADSTLENYLLNQDAAVRGFQAEVSNPSDEIDPNKIYPMPSSPVHASFPSFQPVLSRVAEDDFAEQESVANDDEAPDHSVHQQRQPESSVSKTLQKSLSMPWHFDDWQAAFNQNVPGTSKRPNKGGQHKRRSSLFAGISLTSQLVERMNEDTITKNDQPIRLMNSTSTPNTSLHRRTGSHLVSIFNGITNLQSDGGKSQSTAEDAVAINIPTLSSIAKNSKNTKDDNTADRS
ncbi:magnesium transporter NIPA-domain-containing protein [Umbelopsis sp. PMI_123]|nr:magnesium transporter NIPA-domain-containing protein [Umbelopsis sp. PMI_123]